MKRYDLTSWKKYIDNDYKENKNLSDFSFLKWKEEKLKEIDLINKRDKKFVNIVLFVSTIISMIFSFLILKYFGPNIDMSGWSVDLGGFLMCLNFGSYIAINFGNLEIKSWYYHSSKKYVEKFSLRFL